MVALVIVGQGWVYDRQPVNPGHYHRNKLLQSVVYNLPCLQNT